MDHARGGAIAPKRVDHLRRASAHAFTIARAAAEPFLRVTQPHSPAAPDATATTQAAAVSRAGRGVFTTALLFTVLITAWGGNYTLVKIGLRDSGPWLFNALRYGIAFLILASVLVARRGWAALIPFRGERLSLLVVGFMQTALVTGSSTLALEKIEASRTVLIIYSMPVWGAVLSYVLLRERASAAVLAGIALSLAGLALLSAPWALDWTSPSVMSGSLTALIGTIGWALGSVLYRRRGWRTDIWTQNAWQFLVAGMSMSIGAVLFETEPLRPTALYGVIVLYNALVPTILGYWCWLRILERMPVARASQLLMLSPLFGIMLSAALLHEPLTLTLLASAVLIVIGAILSFFRPRPS